jgi:hypothetical protein
MPGRFLDAPKYLAHFNAWKEFPVKMRMGENL